MEGIWYQRVESFVSVARKTVKHIDMDFRKWDLWMWIGMTQIIV